MQVMKFGGGCLRDGRDLLRVAKIVRQSGGVPLALVVSAAYGVTDILDEAVRSALRSEDEVQLYVDRVRQRHFKMLDETVTEPSLRSEVGTAIEERLRRLERLLYGVAYTGEMVDPVRVLVLSQGERLSALLMAGVLRQTGLPSEALESDRIGVVTDGSCDNATADLAEVARNLSSTVRPLIDRGIIPVITGFFGCTPEGKTSSFGRNGSDYSAAVIARALGAQSLHIWKDADGFMTADPRLVPDARRIDELSYYEAAELSYFGAKILHPRTVEPLVGSSISVSIRSVHAPDRVGTIVRPDGRAGSNVVKSVTYNTGVSVLRVHGAGVGHKPGIIGDIGRRLSDRGINIYSVITSQTCINLLLDSADSERSVVALRPLVGGVIERIEVRQDVALVAVVGEGVLRTKGIAAMVFSAVAERGINVEMISAGASEVAYYFLVPRGDLESAVRAVHNRAFVQEYRP
ncbi:MAG: aspartate kinase [Candidatus Thorarchaeota archaeon]|nr:aspartate kinase [Candidatus Thorarchaeota archaeon]